MVGNQGGLIAFGVEHKKLLRKGPEKRTFPALQLAPHANQLNNNFGT